MAFARVALAVLVGISAVSCRGSRGGAPKAPEPGAVAGRLTTDDGSPAPSVAAITLAFDPPDDRVPVAEVAATAEGAFDIGNVPPGRYLLTARAKGYSDAGIAVQVGAGERVAAVLRLSPGK